MAVLNAVADGRRRAEDWHAGTKRQQADARRQGERAADFYADPEVQALMTAQAADGIGGEASEAEGR